MNVLWALKRLLAIKKYRFACMIAIFRMVRLCVNLNKKIQTRIVRCNGEEVSFWAIFKVRLIVDVSRGCCIK